jgi:hypothetical protein
MHDSGRIGERPVKNTNWGRTGAVAGPQARDSLALAVEAAKARIELRYPALVWQRCSCQRQ